MVLQDIGNKYFYSSVPVSYTLVNGNDFRLQSYHLYIYLGALGRGKSSLQIKRNEIAEFERSRGKESVHSYAPGTTG